MTSVVYVDLSLDSEEEGPPDVKRPRRDQAKMTASKVLPTKLMHIQKASLGTPASVGLKAVPTATATGTVTGTGPGTIVSTYRSMNIPSSITVTKHSNSNGNLNLSNSKLSVENNNNSNSSNNNNTTTNNNNNNVNFKSLKILGTAWPKTSPANTLATITSVPSPQTMMSKTLEKAGMQQQKTVGKQKLTAKTAAQLLQQKQVTATSIVQLQQQQKQQQQQQQQQKPTLTLPTLQLLQQQQKPTTPTTMLQLQPQPQKLAVTTSMLQLQQHQKSPAITAQKPMLQQQKPLKAPLQQQQKSQTSHQLSLTKKLPVKQKPQTAQRLPTLQKMPPTLTSTVQPKPGTPLKLSQPLPPPAHSANSSVLVQSKQKQQQLQLQLQQQLQQIQQQTSPASNAPPQLVKVTPMPMLSRQSGLMPSAAHNSAARTLPYKMKTAAAPTTIVAAAAVTATATGPAATAAAAATTTVMPIAIRNVQHLAPSKSTSLTSSTPMQSITAGATPPLRLLATPPHCAAALNEPLLLNLPPTTSITPQLTPTTTPPPPPPSVTAKITFPGASISPVNKAVPKRVQPITVLKKSDEEWRRHIAQQQQQQQQQQQNKPKEQVTATPTIVLVESPPTTPPTDKADNEQAKRKTPPAAVAPAAIVVPTAKDSPPTPAAAAVTNPSTSTNTSSPATRATLVPEYAALLQLCRELDKSKDMERLIEIKLLKYYHSVHESFVRSRGFRKQLEQTMVRMRNEPDMIYVHLKCVVDELKVRRKAKLVGELPQEETAPAAAEKTPAPVPAPASAPAPVATPPVAPINTAEIKAVEPAPAAPATTISTGNKRTDERIRKLNRTLYTITKRISALEEADVDWNDDDDSSYLQVERFKKRACQIYEKICDLTGESKSAHRQMKQPILFKDSPYPQFNRTLSAFVNRMHEFPDYYDVLQLLEHCNKDKNLGLATFEMKRIAHDAFVKVGRLLQARRKTDLYETVTHFTANAKDPAASDAALLAKLNDNNKKQTKISDILEKFAREQDLTTEEQREARLKEKQIQAAALAAAAAATTVTSTATDAIKTTNDKTVAAADDEKPCTSAQAAQAAQAQAQTAQVELTNGSKKHQGGDSEHESDSSDDEDDDETDEDVDAFVDNFKANGDLSDAESETEANAAPKTTAAAATHVIVNNVTRVKTAAPSSIVGNDYDKSVDNDVDEKAAAKAKAKVKELPNGKVKDAPAARILKIMSVSSLNATVCNSSKNNNNNNNNNNSTSNNKSSSEQPQQQKKQQILTDTEIVISDEES